MSLAEAWERHSEKWIAWARTPDHDAFWYGTWPELQRLLRPSDQVVIDLGCGEGRSARQLEELGHRVIGIELSPSLVAAARTGNPPVQVIQADGSCLPLASQSTDLLVASMFLMDVDEFERTVSEIARVLQPSGRLCFAIVHPFASAADVESFDSDQPTFSHQYLEERRYQVEDELDGLKMTFVSMHRPLSDYMNALAKAGLFVTEMREFGYRPTPWLLVAAADKLPMPT